MNLPPSTYSSDVTLRATGSTPVVLVAAPSVHKQKGVRKWLARITRMFPRNWRFFQGERILPDRLEQHARSRAALLEGLKPELCAEIGRRASIEENLKRAKNTAEVANRERSEFLAQLGYELRASVLTMNGSAHRLRSAALQPEHVRIVQTLCQTSQSLLTTLNDLIDLSTIEAGRLSLDRLVFDLRERVRVATALFAGEIASRGLALTIQVDPAIPQRVCGDPLRLQQIIIHLLDNAVRFTERGSIGVNVWLVWARPERLRLRFEVTDTGIGIPARTCALLFRPFVCAEQPMKRPGGIGFGLAICRRLAALMHGEIGVESTASVGSKFWFTVEFEQAVARPQAAAAETSGVTQPAV